MAEKTCPIVRGKCLEHGCHWYIQLLGKHPQKDAPIEEWGCSMSFLPILLIENAQMIRHHTASVDKARSEAREDTGNIMHSVAAMANQVGHAAQLAFVKRETLEIEAKPTLLGRLRLALKGD